MNKKISIITKRVMFNSIDIFLILNKNNIRMLFYKKACHPFQKLPVSALYHPDYEFYNPLNLCFVPIAGETKSILNLSGYKINKTRIILIATINGLNL